MEADMEVAEAATEGEEEKEAVEEGMAEVATKLRPRH